MLEKFSKEILAFIQKETGVSIAPTNIEHTPNLEMGDYAVGCFELSKKLKKNPAETARDLAQKFSSPLFEKAQAQGPYLNFFVKKDLYQCEILKDVLNQKERYGTKNIGQGKKVVLEYSSPNIAKPFHVGHFRATNLGNALKNTYQALGYQTVSINYLGDWGTQFGKLITAYKKWGDPQQLKKDPIPYLTSLYVKFHEEVKTDTTLEDAARAWFQKCEAQDPEALSLWKQFKDLSLQEFQKLYSQLNITLDQVSGESQYNDQIQKTIDTLKAKGLTQKSEGALIVDLEKDKLPPALLLKTDGASLYLTRDIAALLDRYERLAFDQKIYVVGIPQTLHFKQLFKIMERMEKTWAKSCHHVAFGTIRLKDQAMSTRMGTAILLEDVLSKAKAKIAKIIQSKNPNLKNQTETAKRVALGALIFADFGSKRMKDVTFDWDIILNPEGDTGPYVHYTYARAASILRKVKQGEIFNPSTYNTLASPEEQALFRILERYPNTLEGVAGDFEPFYLSSYLIELSKAFNRFYHHHRVLQAEMTFQKSRILLTQATKQVLENGLRLLGVLPVSEL